MTAPGATTWLASKVREALVEDLGEPFHDVTSEAVVPEGLWGEARIEAREPGVVAGLAGAAEVVAQVDPAAEFDPRLEDGAALEAGTVIAGLRGRMRSLLMAERLALNLLQQLSGVASLTRRYVEAAGPGVQILDTRKTPPGLREAFRDAVRAGGGFNHRFNLAGAILIKDNHVAAAGGVAPAVASARATGLEVEVEVENLEQLEAALDSGADIVLLDNMAPAQVAEAVRMASGRARLEVSGGVNLETVAAYAATGVDRISVGALTHSAPALDIAMEVTRTWLP